MTDTDRMVAWLREAMDAAQRDAEAAVGQWSDVSLPFSTVAHTERHSPAAVLRRIAADHEILEWCTEVIGDTDLSTYEQFGSLRDHPQALAVTLAVETIRNLAKGYGWKGGDQ